VHGRGLTAARGGYGIVGRDDRFACAAGSHQKGGRSAIGSTAEQRVQFGYAARDRLRLKGSAMLGRDEPGIDLDSACMNLVVVITARVRLPSKLRDPEPSPIRTIVWRAMIEVDHAMGYGLYRRLGILSAVAEHSRASASCEIVLQNENLAPIPERIRGYQPDFRQRIDDQTLRVDLVDDRQERFHGPWQLDLSRMENRLSGPPFTVVERAEVVHGDTIERPPVAFRDLMQLLV